MPIISASATPLYVGAQPCEPVAVQAFQYQANAGPLVVSGTPPETVTEEKWDRGQSQPQVTVRRSAEFTTFVIDNSSLLTPERNSLDKWIVRIEQPRQDIKREQWRSPSLFAERLDSVPATTTALYVSSQSTEPTSIIGFQYQGLAKPVVTPGASPEAVTADKWLGEWSPPYFRPRRLIQYGANCAIAEQVDDGLPPVWWLPAHNQTVSARLGTRSTSGADPIRVVEAITQDKWQQPTSIPRTPLNRARVETSVIDPGALAQAEQTQIDKWEQPTARPAFKVGRRQRLFPAVTDERLFVVPDVESVTVDKWSNQHPEQIFRQKRANEFPTLAIDSRLLTQAEWASIDKWQQLQSVPKWDVKRSQYSYPALSIDTQFYLIPPIEIIRLDKWSRQYPDTVLCVRRLSDYTQFTIDPTLRNESAFLDKWGWSSDQPRTAIRITQSEQPFLFVPSETVTLDKWLGSSSRSLAQRPKLILSSEHLLFVSEIITVDKWLLQPDQPQPKARCSTLLPLDQVLFARELVTPDKWLQSQSQPLRSANRLMVISDQLPVAAEGSTLGKLLTDSQIPYFSRPRVFAVIPDVLTNLPLSEWRELVQPFMPRDVKRNQYFYLVSSAGTDISLTLERGVIVTIKPDHRIIIVPVDHRIIKL